jgi:copper(I)-binding protein
MQMMMITARYITVFTFLVAGLGIGAGSVLAADIVLDGLQFRATVGSIPSSAGYLTIQNNGTDNDWLMAATSDLARKTELHSMTMDNGVMRMRQVEGGIPVPAGQMVTLAPGGYHIMLIGLNAPLHAGQAYDVTLDFRHAGPMTISGIAVKPAEISIGSGAMTHGYSMPKSAH